MSFVVTQEEACFAFIKFLNVSYIEH